MHVHILLFIYQKQAIYPWVSGKGISYAQQVL